MLDPAGEPIFFQSRTGPYIPTLRLLHRFPDVLPSSPSTAARSASCSGREHHGAGAHLGGRPMDTVEHLVVGVFAEGKEHALAIGVATMARADPQGEQGDRRREHPLAERRPVEPGLVGGGP